MAQLRAALPKELRVSRADQSVTVNPVSTKSGEVMPHSSQRPSRLRDRVVLLALLGLTLLPVLLLWREMATGSRSAEGTISEPSAEDEIQAGARLRAPQETATDRRAEPRAESARGAHGAGSNESDGTPLGSASITGRLYDSHDQPVSNAEVSVVATLQGSSPRVAQAVGANGFEITGLFPGIWVLSTTSEGRHAWRSRIDLLANEVRHVDIVLSSTRVVPVYVVSSRGERLVVDASLEALLRSSFLRVDPATSCEAPPTEYRFEEEFENQGVRLLVGTLTVRSRGFACYALYLGNVLVDEQPLAETEDALEFTIPDLLQFRPGSLRVKTHHEESGRPETDGEVTLEVGADAYSRPLGEDGTATFALVPPGPVKVSLATYAGAQAVDELEIAPGEDSEVTLTIVPQASVHVEVRGPDGEPVSGATVVSIRHPWRESSSGQLFSRFRAHSELTIQMPEDSERVLLARTGAILSEPLVVRPSRHSEGDHQLGLGIPLIEVPLSLIGRPRGETWLVEDESQRAVAIGRVSGSGVDTANLYPGKFSLYALPVGSDPIFVRALAVDP